MARLVVDALSIAFGGLTALAGVGFAAGEGEIVAIIGPNGAGKTTVFNLLSGLYRPSAGRVTLDDVDLTRLAPHEIARRGVGRTFQNTEVFRALSALDNVRVGAHRRLRSGLVAAACGWAAVRREERQTTERSRALLERVGIGDVAEVEAGL